MGRNVVVAIGCVACVGCLMTPVMHFGSGKTAKQAQHDTMAEFTPGQLDEQDQCAGSVRELRVRVWADDEFRGQNTHWQEAFEDQLRPANKVLAAKLCIALAPEFQTWDRHAPGATLAEDLDALAAIDPGDGVFAVIGLTSSLSLVAATFEELGIAHINGNHMILRGYADLAERKQFEKAFPDLRADEREASLFSLRRHKTSLLLLHELGHNLGMDHEKQPDTIMYASYSREASSYSSAARERMMQTLFDRLQSGSRGSLAAGAQAQVSPSAPRSITFAVTEQGQVMHDGNIVVGAAINSLLSKAHALNPETEVVIQKRKNTPTSAVAGLVDRAKAAGLERVSITIY